MSNLAKNIKDFNYPNYNGEIYSAIMTNTPFLSLIGGVGGVKALQTKNSLFPTCSLYKYPVASQPAISEKESLTAPDDSYLKSNETNVTQIFQERITISYDSVLSKARLLNINSYYELSRIEYELIFQTARTLEKISRDIEYTFLNGIYAGPSSTPTTARKTRGMIEAASQGAKIDAEKEPITKKIIDEALEAAYSNRAQFKDLYFFVNSYQKLAISETYFEQKAYHYHYENFYGINIESIDTDFGNIKIILDRFIPHDVLLAADLSVIAPVEQLIPGKGNFFLEKLAKNGAAEQYQIFGEIGLDHGPSFMHFIISNLKYN
ncbi:MAG: DUF5309 domain-containing protein [Clostridiales bacterium]|jgi:hypothetical protein|nr:DUF5309 domain-containing protein [Clostridiales bacterium]